MSTRSVDIAADVEAQFLAQCGADGRTPVDTTTDAQLRASFTNGSDRYVAMMKLSARWAARGMPADDIEAALLDLLGNNSLNGDGVDLATRARPFAVSAVAKYGESRKGAQNSVQGVPGDAELPAHPKEPDYLATIRAAIIANLEAGADAIDNAQPPRFVVDKLLPVAGANFCGAGGASKTTVCLNEMVHITNGSDLYGREVIQQGQCVLVTAEDGADYANYVLQQIIADGLDSGQLHPQHAHDAKPLIKIVSWPRAAFGPFAYAASDGTIVKSAAFDLLLELLAPYDPAYITADPAALFGAGERFGNDGDSFLASMIHEAALKLGCCFQLIDHVSQSVARMGIVDQHAARGGTAKTDNARLARQLVKFKGDGTDGNVPPSVTPDDLDKGRILQLHTTKSNYAPLPPMVWLRRRRFWIEHLRGVSSDEASAVRKAQHEQSLSADVLAVIEAVKLARAAGQRWSKQQLEDAGAMDLTGQPIPRNRLRGAIARALRDRLLCLLDLPQNERQGARRQYLETVSV